MFGFRNYTGISFVGKINRIGVEFAVDIGEEVTFNVISSTVANAAEIPENLNFNLPAKDQILATASTAIGSKIIQSNVFDLIAGATPNLFLETDLVSNV